MNALIKNDSGFTLLEIVVSMVILGIAFVPLINLFYSSRENYGRSTETTIAVNLAQQKMEELIDKDPAAILENSSSWSEFPDAPGYFYQLEVTQTDSNLKLFQIDVRIKYQAMGKDQTFSLSTYSIQ